MQHPHDCQCCPPMNCAQRARGVRSCIGWVCVCVFVFVRVPDLKLMPFEYVGVESSGSYSLGAYARDCCDVLPRCVGGGAWDVIGALLTLTLLARGDAAIGGRRLCSVNMKFMHTRNHHHHHHPRCYYCCYLKISIAVTKNK